MDACFPNNSPPLHTPCLVRVGDLHWSRGCHYQADSWDVGNRGASGPGWDLGVRAWAMLMEGTYIGSVSGEVLISDGGQTATADDLVGAQIPGDPHLQNSTPLPKGRDSRSLGK